MVKHKSTINEQQNKKDQEQINNKRQQIEYSGTTNALYGQYNSSSWGVVEHS